MNKAELQKRYQLFKDLNEFINYLEQHLKVMDEHEHAGAGALYAVEGNLINELVNGILKVDCYVSYFGNSHNGSGFYVDSAWHCLRYSKTFIQACNDLERLNTGFLAGNHE